MDRPVAVVAVRALVRARLGALLQAQQAAIARNNAIMDRAQSIAHQSTALRRPWETTRHELGSAAKNTTRAELRAVAATLRTFASVHPIAATGSITFRATSLPPPALS